MSSKGQVFSADALLGILVFLFALSIVFYYFDQIYLRDSEFSENFEMKSIAFNSLSSLVETPGFPENWQEIELSRVKSIGLASQRNVLSAEKISSFEKIYDSDYNSLRKSLGLGKFEFAFSIYDLNGSKILSLGSSSGFKTSFKNSRLAALNKNPVFVSLEVFK